MNINILTSNNKFSFDIRDKDKCVFSSSRDSITTASVKPYYNSSWEACSAARNFVNDCPFQLMYRKAYEVNDASSGYAEGEGLSTDKSPADFLEENYIDILKRMTMQLRNPTPEGKTILHKSLTSFIIELTNLYQMNAKDGRKEEAQVSAALLKKFTKLLRSKFAGKMAELDIQGLNQQLNPQKDDAAGGGLPGMASRKTLVVTASGDILEKRIDSETVGELLEDYATQACLVLQGTNNVVYDIEQAGDNCYINIYDLVGKDEVEKIIVIRINKFLHVDSVLPVGKLNKIYPFYSVYFYQKYWKPIVDSIGHYYLDDTDSLIMSNKNEMPDLPKDDETYSLEAWDISDKKLEYIDISFKGGDIWFFEKKGLKREASSEAIDTSSRYTEQDYLNAIIMCTDKNQPNLYGEIGQVVQVIPLEDMIEVDVKFISFVDKDHKIQKSKESEIPIDGLVVRLSEDQLKILDNSEIASIELGV